MTDRELIKRLLFLAQTAVDQALDLNYDDPEDYFIYRELRELKAAALAQPEPEPSRPECFDFAMDFVGDPEETEVRRYVEALEARAALAQPEPQGLTDEELEERFQRWWFSEGSGMRPLNGEDQEEHAHRVSQAAWHNGAYVERYGRPAIEPVHGVEGEP
jgi:hypothetical protein